jgi:hypothetical protein
MNKILLSSALAIILFFGCRKDEKITNPETHHVTTIKGIKDITINAIDSISIPLTISSNDKDHYVKLEIYGMPNYLSASFAPTIGIPNFATYLTLISNRGVVGKPYTLNLKAITESGIEDTFNLHLNVTYDAQCVDHMVGVYNSHYECTKSGASTGANVNISKIDDHTMIAEHLQIGHDNVDTVLMNVNCEQELITIPDQWRSPGYHFFEAQGTYAANRIDLTYTVETWETCVVTLTR